MGFLHDLKIKMLKKKLESTKIRSQQAHEELEIKREIKKASKINYTQEELDAIKKREEQKKKDKKAMLDKTGDFLDGMFNTLGEMADAANDLLSDDKPKKKKKKANK